MGPRVVELRLFTLALWGATRAFLNALKLPRAAADSIELDHNARQLTVDIQVPCSPAAGPLSTPESPERRHNERSCSLRSCSHVKPVRWVQVVAQPHQLPITCRVARKNWSQEEQLRECAGGAHSGGPPIRSASEALISTASTIVMLPTSPDD